MSKQASRTNWAVQRVVVAFALVLAGCSANRTDEAAGAADCSRQVRVGGVVYASYGYGERAGTRYAAADVADCDDVGPSPAGSVFRDHPTQVTTWTFQGYQPGKVLGVRVDSDSYAIFVAESVPREERDRIFRALSEPEH